MVEITKKSDFTGKENTMDLPVTWERINNWIVGHDTRLVQDAFPDLDDDQREFLMTGVTPEEWDSIFPPEYDDFDLTDDESPL